MSRKIMLIAGARPNFMKIAPIHAQLSADDAFEVTLVHTGQHYDEKMSELFFKQLGIPEPDVNLEVGSSSHATQLADIMKRFEPLVLDERPDLVVVVGDVNSTAACAMVAKKIHGVAVAHVEAGLRSFDRRMPEEINRLVTDALSDLLFTSERSGDRHLKAEGIPDSCIHFVGNVMIDTLRTQLNRARETGTVDEFGLVRGGYALVTLHRPSNVDARETFDPLMNAIGEISGEIPVVFPVHPRTRRVLNSWTEERGGLPAGLRLTEPLGYLQFLDLMSGARLVMTDSGGIQEETTVLGVPCLTLRENTERPVTVDVGTNLLLGTDAERLRVEARRVLAGEGKQGSIPEGWDGRASERIAAALRNWRGEVR